MYKILCRFILASLILSLTSCGFEKKHNVDDFNASQIKKDVPVFNYGVSGNNTNDLLKRIDSISFSKNSLVIILIGTNDALNWAGNDINIDLFESNYSIILNKIYSKTRNVIILSIPKAFDRKILNKYRHGFFSNYKSPKSKVDAYNSRINLLASIYKIDIVHTSQIIDENDYVSDGLHFNDDYYKKLSKLIYNFAKSKNLKFEDVYCLGDSLTFGAYAIGSYPEYLSDIYNIN
ncbi:SGNH/GDSL hydrolase family protein [Shewanella sp.]|uniref:SGNH/GDSL hydrolase family protein n=1 Tax=Shewanella sp. TaxID=50422 RepID=UPI003A9798B0